MTGRGALPAGLRTVAAKLIRHTTTTPDHLLVFADAVQELATEYRRAGVDLLAADIDDVALDVQTAAARLAASR